MVNLTFTENGNRVDAALAAFNAALDRLADPDPGIMSFGRRRLVSSQGRLLAPRARPATRQKRFWEGSHHPTGRNRPAASATWATQVTRADDEPQAALEALNGELAALATSVGFEIVAGS